jgi:hypothetical protein
MCSSKPKVTNTTVAPAATPAPAEIGNARQEATKKARRRMGFDSQNVATDRLATLLGAVSQSNGNQGKKYLGD